MWFKYPTKIRFTLQAGQLEGTTVPLGSTSFLGGGNQKPSNETHSIKLER